MTQQIATVTGNVPSTRFAGLPDVSSLVGAFKKYAAKTKGEKNLLKCDGKTGTWSYGVAHQEIEKGSQWAVDPFSFIHGWIAFNHNNEKVAELAAPLNQEMPERTQLPEGAKDWQEQTGFSMKCVAGDDEGLVVQFRASSASGVRAVGELVGRIGVQVEKDKNHPVLITELEIGVIPTKFGKVYFPVFEEVEWVSIDEFEAIEPIEPETETQPEPEPVKELVAPAPVATEAQGLRPRVRPSSR